MGVDKVSQSFLYQAQPLPGFGDDPRIWQVDPSPALGGLESDPRRGPPGFRRWAKVGLVAGQGGGVLIIEARFFLGSAQRGAVVERASQNLGAEYFPVVSSVKQVKVPHRIEGDRDVDDPACLS